MTMNEHDFNKRDKPEHDLRNWYGYPDSNSSLWVAFGAVVITIGVIFGIFYLLGTLV